MACTVANTFYLFWSLPEQGSATTSIELSTVYPTGCYWYEYHHLPFTRSIKKEPDLPAVTSCRHTVVEAAEKLVFVYLWLVLPTLSLCKKNHSKDNCCYMPELFAIFAQTTYHMMHLLQVLGIMWYSWESNPAAAYICRQSLVSEAHVVLLAVSRYSLVNYTSLCIRTQS